MKDFIIISGKRCSGKTYKMVSYAVKSSMTCANNVFIITSNPRSLDYFENIIINKYPSLIFERRKDGFLFEIKECSWFIYCVSLCDIKKYYRELSEADEIMIDEYLTFSYLMKDEKIVNCMEKTKSVFVTISDYDFGSKILELCDFIKKFKTQVTLKSV